MLGLVVIVGMALAICYFAARNPKPPPPHPVFGIVDSRRRGNGACPHYQYWHPFKLYTMGGVGCDVRGCPAQWVDHG